MQEAGAHVLVAPMPFGLCACIVSVTAVGQPAGGCPSCGLAKVYRQDIEARRAGAARLTALLSLLLGSHRAAPLGLVDAQPSAASLQLYVQRCGPAIGALAEALSRLVAHRGKHLKSPGQRSG